MIQLFRNPEADERPAFVDIMIPLQKPDFQILQWSEQDKKSSSDVARTLGSSLEAGLSLHRDLQRSYLTAAKAQKNSKKQRSDHGREKNVAHPHQKGQPSPRDNGHEDDGYEGDGYEDDRAAASENKEETLLVSGAEKQGVDKDETGDRSEMPASDAGYEEDGYDLVTNEEESVSSPKRTSMNIAAANHEREECVKSSGKRSKSDTGFDDELPIDDENQGTQPFSPLLDEGYSNSYAVDSRDMDNDSLSDGYA